MVSSVSAWCFTKRLICTSFQLILRNSASAVLKCVGRDFVASGKPLTKEQKTYIKDNIDTKFASVIARELGLTRATVMNYVKSGEINEPEEGT